MTPAPAARRPGRRALGLLVACTVAVLPACGDDDDGGGDEEAATLCDARDELTDTVAAVRDVDVSAEGTDALDAAVADVRLAVDDVAEAAGEDLQDDVDLLRSALDDLQEAVGTLDQADSTAAAVESVSTSVAATAAAVTALTNELADGCA